MKTLAQLTMLLDDFRKERNWQQFHTPAELARALMVEAAELNKLFLWNRDPDPLDEVAAEIADIIIYALYLADHYGLVPEECIEAKMQANAAKYPVGHDHAKQRGWRK